ncbi:hypothetical protein ACHAWC_005465 [Mediolabrus comicus]
MLAKSASSTATATAVTIALLAVVSIPAISALALSSSSSSPGVVGRRTILGSIKQPQLQTRPISPANNITGLPLLISKILLKIGHGKHLREEVVHKYFHGVDTKNIPQIIDCFHPDGAIIRDVCALTNRDVSYENVGKLVSPQFLGERCNEFLNAHPNCIVKFHHGPTCGRGSDNNWVYAHWYEEGSFSGTSQGIEPDGSPLTVQGQTRFLVGNDLKIREIVITRTFSSWEEQLLLKNSS